jgi:predicted nuclease with TOPRIM domain
MEAKHPLKSKTVNANILATGVIFALEHFGFKVSPEIAVAIMGVGNVLLRFVSESPIGFKAVNLSEKVSEFYNEFVELRRKFALLYKGYQEIQKRLEVLENETRNIRNTEGK